MGFPLERLWVIGYEGVMGYGSGFPAYQLGKLKILWGLREYGFSGVWVRRELTVLVYYDMQVLFVSLPSLNPLRSGFPRSHRRCAGSLYILSAYVLRSTSNHGPPVCAFAVPHHAVPLGTRLPIITDANSIHHKTVSLHMQGSRGDFHHSF